MPEEEVPDDPNQQDVNQLENHDDPVNQDNNDNNKEGPEGVNVADPEGVNVADPEGVNVADPEGVNVADPEGVNVADPEGVTLNELMEMLNEGAITMYDLMDSPHIGSLRQLMGPLFLGADADAIKNQGPINSNPMAMPVPVTMSRLYPFQSQVRDMLGIIGNIYGQNNDGINDEEGIFDEDEARSFDDRNDNDPDYVSDNEMPPLFDPTDRSSPSSERRRRPDNDTMSQSDGSGSADSDNDGQEIRGDHDGNEEEEGEGSGEEDPLRDQWGNLPDFGTHLTINLPNYVPLAAPLSVYSSSKKEEDEKKEDEVEQQKPKEKPVPKYNMGNLHERTQSITELITSSNSSGPIKILDNSRTVGKVPIEQFNHDVWIFPNDFSNDELSSEEEVMRTVQRESLFDQISSILPVSVLTEEEQGAMKFNQFLQNASNGVQTIMGHLYENLSWTFNPIDKFMWIYLQLACRYEVRAIKYLMNSPFYNDELLLKKDRYNVSCIMLACQSQSDDILKQLNVNGALKWSMFAGPNNGANNNNGIDGVPVPVPVPVPAPDPVAFLGGYALDSNGRRYNGNGSSNSSQGQGQGQRRFGQMGAGLAPVEVPPIMYAVQNVPVLKYILENVPDATNLLQTKYKGFTPFLYSCNEYKDSVTYLLGTKLLTKEHFEDTVDGKTCLMLAAISDDYHRNAKMVAQVYDRKGKLVDNPQIDEHGRLAGDYYDQNRSGIMNQYLSSYLGMSMGISGNGTSKNGNKSKNNGTSKSSNEKVTSDVPKEEKPVSVLKQLLSSELCTEDLFRKSQKDHGNLLLLAHGDPEMFELILSSKFMNKAMFMTTVEYPWIDPKGTNQPVKTNILFENVHDTDILVQILTSPYFDKEVMEFTVLGRTIISELAHENQEALKLFLDSELITTELFNKVDKWGETCFSIAVKHNIKALSIIMESRFFTSDLLLTQDADGRNGIVKLIMAADTHGSATFNQSSMDSLLEKQIRGSDEVDGPFVNFYRNLSTGSRPINIDPNFGEIRGTGYYINRMPFGSLGSASTIVDAGPSGFYGNMFPFPVISTISEALDNERKSQTRGSIDEVVEAEVPAAVVAVEVPAAVVAVEIPAAVPVNDVPAAIVEPDVQAAIVEAEVQAAVPVADVPVAPAAGPPAILSSEDMFRGIITGTFSGKQMETIETMTHLMKKYAFPMTEYQDADEVTVIEKGTVQIQDPSGCFANKNNNKKVITFSSILEQILDKFMTKELLEQKCRYNLNTFAYMCIKCPTIARKIMATDLFSEKLLSDTHTGKVPMLFAICMMGQDESLIKDIIKSDKCPKDLLLFIGADKSTLLMELCKSNPTSQTIDTILDLDSCTTEYLGSTDDHDENFLFGLLRNTMYGSTTHRFEKALKHKSCSTSIVNQMNDRKETLFLLACRVSTKTVRMILESPHFDTQIFATTDTNGMNGFLNACRSNNYELVTMIGNHDAFTEEMFNSTDQQGKSPIMYAMESSGYSFSGNSSSIMKYILDHKFCKEDQFVKSMQHIVNQHGFSNDQIDFMLKYKGCTQENIQLIRDKRGVNCLIYALGHSNQIVVRILESPLCSYDLLAQKDQNGRAVLSHCKYSSDLVGYIVGSKHFRTALLEQTDELGYTPMDIFLQAGNMAAITMIAQSDKIDDSVMKIPFKDGGNMMTKMVTFGLVDTLLPKESVTSLTMKIVDGKGWTWLHHAVQGPLTNSRYGQVKKIIESDKCDSELLEMQDESGDTFLTLNYKFLDIVIKSPKCTTKLLETVNKAGLSLLSIICIKDSDKIKPFLDSPLVTTNVFNPRKESDGSEPLNEITPIISCIGLENNSLSQLLLSDKCENEYVNRQLLSGLTLRVASLTPLSYAVLLKHEEAVSTLLTSKFDLTPSFESVDDRGHNIIMLAAQSTPAIFKMLIESKYMKEDYMYKADKYGHNAITFAFGSDFKIVERIMESAWFSDKLMYHQDIDKDFLLLYAANRPDVVQFVVNHDKCTKQLVQSENELKMTALHHYATKYSDSLVEMLKSPHVDQEFVERQDVYGQTCFHVACKSTDTAKIIVESPFFTESLLLKQNKKGENGLMLVLKHCSQLVTAVLASDSCTYAVLEQQDVNGNSALMYASEFSQPSLDKLIKSKNFKADLFSHRNWAMETPLMYSCRFTAKLVELYLKIETIGEAHPFVPENRVLYSTHTDHGSCMTIAAKSDQSMVIKLLLNWANLDWRILNTLQDKKTFVQHACAFSPESVRYVVNSDRDMSFFFEDTYVEHPIMIAARSQPDALKYLLDSKYMNERMLTISRNERTCIDEAYDYQPRSLLFLIRCKLCTYDVLNQEDLIGYKLINKLKEIYPGLKTFADIEQNPLTEYNNVLAPEGDPGVCNICCAYKTQVYFSNCGHTTCIGCAFKLKDCHHCRGTIAERRVIYS